LLLSEISGATLISHRFSRQRVVIGDLHKGSGHPLPLAVNVEITTIGLAIPPVLGATEGRTLKALFGESFFIR
jgi:hypothetical protein